MDPLLACVRTHFLRRRAALACALRLNLLSPGSIALPKNAHGTCFLLRAVVQGVAAPFCGSAFDSKLVPHLLQKWGHKLIPKWVRFAFVNWVHFSFQNWVRFVFEKWFHCLFKKWGRGAVGRHLGIAQSGVGPLRQSCSAAFSASKIPSSLQATPLADAANFPGLHSAKLCFALRSFCMRLI